MTWGFRSPFFRLVQPVPVVAPARLDPPPMRIHPSARAAARRRVIDPEQIFAPARPMPGVMPAADESLAMDAARSHVSQLMANDDGSYFQTASLMASFMGPAAYGEGLLWLGYPMLAQLAQVGEFRQMATVLAREMTRKWIKWGISAGDAKADKVAQLEDRMKRLRVRDIIREAIECDALYGCAHIYKAMNNADINNIAELRSPLPLDKAKIQKGSLKGFKVIQPMWCYPMTYNATSPLVDDWYSPQSWFVMSRELHSDRLLRLVSREVPDMMKPAYAFGGLSLTQMTKPYVDNWLRTRQSVSDLTHNFSIMALKTNMASILQGESAENLFARADLFNDMRDNRGLFLMAKGNGSSDPGEELVNVAAPLSGLAELQQAAQEQRAGICGIPLVVLLCLTPSGLNASSDGEVRTFYAKCLADLETYVRPVLSDMIDTIQLDEFGEIDPDLNFTFADLWELDEEKKAAVQKTRADTHSAYLTEGIVSPDEVRETVARDEESPYQGLDLSSPAPGPPMPDTDDIEAQMGDLHPVTQGADNE